VAALQQTTWGRKDTRHFLSREEEYVGALRASLGIWWAPGVAWGVDVACGAMVWAWSAVGARPHARPHTPQHARASIRREKMKKEQLSLEDGVTMRSLVDFPGGLELHIGVGVGGRPAACACCRHPLTSS